MAGETAASIQDNHDQIILAMIALLGTSIAALVYTIKNNSLGRDINKAVNNVGPGEHHLIDLIKQIKDKQEQFDRAWGNLPDDIDDAVGLVELLHGMNGRIQKVNQALADHVAWEMAVKYQQEESHE
jgi:uncharacterized membrane protein